MATNGKRKWLLLDYPGTVLSIGMVTAFLIPLQWAGNTKSWNDPVIIALLVVVSPCGRHGTFDFDLSIGRGPSYLVHPLRTLPRRSRHPSAETAALQIYTLYLLGSGGSILMNTISCAYVVRHTGTDDRRFHYCHGNYLV